MATPSLVSEVGRPARHEDKAIGARTVRGVFWTLLFSVLNKVIAMGAQVGVARYLSPKDIGLVATATSVVGILSFLLGGQLQRILIQRQETFEQDAGQVFWLSLAMNLVVAALVAGTASMVSRIFGAAALKSLLWIVAAAIPVMALPVAYGAKLSIDLRFGLVSVLSFGEGLIRNVGGVVLAIFGFGPRSLVIPLFFSALFAAIAQRKSAGPIRVGKPEPARWKPLLAPAVWLMLNASVTSLIGYGANLIIAGARSMEVAGLYYWGFSMSAQAVFLLVTNLQSVLFPAFASLGGNASRQRQAFEQTIAILTAVVVPIACLQVILAGPVIGLLFQPRWLPAVGVVQWLSVGMLTQPLNVVGFAALMAKGEFRKVFVATSIMAALSLMATLIGSSLGEQSVIARYVGLATLAGNVAPGWMACQALAGRARRFWNCVGLPILLGTPSAATGWFLDRTFGASNLVLRMALVGLAVLSCYAALIHIFCPDLSDNVRARLRNFRSRRLSSQPA